jgi:transcription elongation factor GreA
MAKLRLISAHGETVLEWNPGQAAAGEAAAQTALCQAERLFLTASARGATAFQVVDGQPLAPLVGFDPQLVETILVPRIAGGAISPHDLNLMTQAGMTRLEDELERLRTVERDELAGRLREARESPGDQSDNLELLEAQRDYSLLEARIADLEFALAQAQVVQAPTGDHAEVGSVVHVSDEDGEEEAYTLVGPAEADPRRGLISIASPVGHALFGTQAGDETVVETPNGSRRLKVIRIS